MVNLYGFCFKYCIYCASVPSLHSESTDCLILSQENHDALTRRKWQVHAWMKIQICMYESTCRELVQVQKVCNSNKMCNAYLMTACTCMYIDGCVSLCCNNIAASNNITHSPCIPQCTIILLLNIANMDRLFMWKNAVKVLWSFLSSLAGFWGFRSYMHLFSFVREGRPRGRSMVCKVRKYITLLFTKNKGSR